MSQFQNLRRFPAFVVAASICVIYIPLDAKMHFHALDKVLNALSLFEDLQAHEIILMMLFLICAFAFDQYRRVLHLRQQRDNGRTRVCLVRATLATVQDVVNNALNGFVFIHHEAETTKTLSPQTLQVFEGLIANTSQELKKIHEIEDVSERSLGDSMSVLNVEEKHSDQLKMHSLPT